jgi:CBS-domain-containing membrane protein
MSQGDDTHRPALRRRRPGWLRRWPPRLLSAGFVFVNGFLTIGLLAGLAVFFRTPFVFPSLGPTAFLLYFMPAAPAARPRHTLCGHAVGIACGYASLWLVGLEHAPSAMAEGVHWPRVFAAALSLAATGALMILLGVVHPPAGATTLIITLGFITTPIHLCVIEIAVALVVLQALALNRLVGVESPPGPGRIDPPESDP